jgi:hypothetical protein
MKGERRKRRNEVYTIDWRCVDATRCALGKAAIVSIDPIWPPCFQPSTPHLPRLQPPSVVECLLGGDSSGGAEADRMMKGVLMEEKRRRESKRRSSA